jgi:putative DNA primase/helicase
VVVERLLSVSGEDTLTVNRKYRDQWTGKLPSRFMVCSNELPQLGDASAAIAGRFVALLLTRSWLGREDRTLEPALQAELPGILNWALDGLERLEARGSFTRPASTDETIVALQDLASPVAAFIRDRCELGAELEVAIDDLYAAWRCWAEDNGHPKSSKQVFGRDLKAAAPRIRVRRPGTAEDRQRVYSGIALKPPPDEAESTMRRTADVGDADVASATSTVTGTSDSTERAVLEEVEQLIREGVLEEIDQTGNGVGA